MFCIFSQINPLQQYFRILLSKIYSSTTLNHPRGFRKFPLMKFCRVLKGSEHLLVRPKCILMVVLAMSMMTMSVWGTRPGRLDLGINWVVADWHPLTGARASMKELFAVQLGNVLRAFWLGFTANFWKGRVHLEFSWKSEYERDFAVSVWNVIVTFDIV